VNLRALLLVLAWAGTAPALAQETSASEDLASAGAGGEAPAVSSDAPVEGEPSSVPSGAVPVGKIDSEASAPNDSSVRDGEAPAEEEAALDELTARLLGDAPPAGPTRTPTRVQEMDLPETPGWIWPVGLTLLALMVGLRWQIQRVPSAPSKLRVSQRVILGRDGNLAVVEVGEGSDRRRLLVGYGGGAPRLVAELDVPDATPGEEQGDVATAGRRWLRAVGRAQQSVGQGSGESGAGSRSSAEARPTLKPRSSLIAEVLAERDAMESASGTDDSGGVSAVVTGPAPETRASPPPSVAPVESDDDPDAPSETYTFRGLIG
jgi:hypothetical protein